MTVKAPTLVDTATFSAGESKSTEKSTNTAPVSFNKIMKQSISSNAKTVSNKNNTSANANSSTVNQNSKINTDNSVQKNNAANANATQKTTATATKTDKTTAANLDSKQMNDAVSKLNQLAEDVKDKIEEELGISDKDLENAMQILGISTLQLLQPENLRQVILQVSGQQDPTALLTSENLLNSLNSIMEFMNNGLEQIQNQFNLDDYAITNMITDLSKQDVADLNQNNQSTTNDQTLKNDNLTDENVTAAQQEQVPKEQQEKVTEDAIASDDTQNLADVLKSKLTVEHHDENNMNEHSQGNQNGEHTMEQNASKTTDNVTQISQNMAQTVQNTFATFIDGQAVMVDSVNIIRQIVDTVKVTTTSQLQSIEIQLNPENLGKVNLTVSSKAGVITAQITAENEQVKKAIESQMTTLKQDFEQQGIKVDAIEVTVRGHEFEAGQNLQGNNEENRKQGRNARRHINADELNEFLNGDSGDTDDVNHNIYSDTSSVNYTA